MTEVEQLLEAASSVLIVDWPSKDVPDTLVRAGYTVMVKGGPEPDNYSVHDLSEGKVVQRAAGRRPEQVDLVYMHRPLEELPGIVAMATDVGAQAVWCQSGLASAGTNDPKGCWVPSTPRGKRAASLSQRACATSMTSTSRTPSGSSDSIGSTAVSSLSILPWLEA